MRPVGDGRGRRVGVGVVASTGDGDLDGPAVGRIGLAADNRGQDDAGLERLDSTCLGKAGRAERQPVVPLGGRGRPADGPGHEGYRCYDCELPGSEPHMTPRP